MSIIDKFLSCKIVLLYCFVFFISSSSFAQFYFFETCRNSTGQFTLGGDAPGYTVNLGVGDNPGQGWLRLTNENTFQAGYVKFTQTFPSAIGIIVEFDFKTWGSNVNKADGFSVFLFNGGAGVPWQIGASGGSLGYSVSGNGPGMVNGYLGIGIDEYGNYALEGSGGGPGTQTPSSIGVRDANFYYIGGTPTNLGLGIQLQHGPASSTRPPDNTYYRRVRIDVEPNGVGGMKVNCYIKTTLSGQWQQVLTNLQVNTPLPATLGLGFAGSTGSVTAYHEVREVIVRTPGDLYVTIPEIPCVFPSDTTAITIHVGNGLGAITDIAMCDTLPAGFSLTAPPTITNTSSCMAQLYNFTTDTLPDGRLICCYLLYMSNYGEVFVHYNGFFSSMTNSVCTISSSLTPPSFNFSDLNPNDNKATRIVSLVQTDTITATICMGESYNFNGTLYDTAGFYTQLYTGINGCDSLFTLNLIVDICPAYDTVQTVICENEGYDFNGIMLFESGIYNDTLSTIYGGDSIITLYLTSNAVYHTILDDAVCIGKPYHKNGFILTAHDSAGLYSYEQYLHTVYDCDSIITLNLQVPEVMVEISSSNPDFCSTYETTLTAITSNSKVEWNTGASTFDIEVTHSGSYMATVSEHNCTAFATYTIEQCPVVIVFPNAISPGNNDGINDYFYLSAANEVYEFALYIYNRWGNCVFTSIDPHFRWDGTIKGKIIQGTYTYVVNYRTNNDKKSKSMKGVVTVY